MDTKTKNKILGTGNLTGNRKADLTGLRDALGKIPKGKTQRAILGFYDTPEDAEHKAGHWASLEYGLSFLTGGELYALIMGQPSGKFWQVYIN